MNQTTSFFLQLAQQEVLVRDKIVTLLDENGKTPWGTVLVLLPLIIALLFSALIAVAHVFGFSLFCMLLGGLWLASWYTRTDPTQQTGRRIHELIAGYLEYVSRDAAGRHLVFRKTDPATPPGYDVCVLTRNDKFEGQTGYGWPIGGWIRFKWTYGKSKKLKYIRLKKVEIDPDTGKVTTVFADAYGKLATFEDPANALELLDEVRPHEKTFSPAYERLIADCRNRTIRVKELEAELQPWRRPTPRSLPE